MLSMWDLLMCIHRNKRLIVFVTAISLVIGYWYTSINQSYTAQVIIKYTGEKAIDGKNENDTEIDPFEISNPQVLERALTKLSLSTSSIENVRKSMKITPIIPTREEEKDKSFIDNAFKMEDEKKYYPVYYKVSLHATAEQGMSFARNMLDAVMEQYMQFYSEQYLNNASVSNISCDLTVDNYDYIKVVDIISDQINSVVEYLSELNKDDNNFRSSSTGLTFSDISNRLMYIKSVYLPVIHGEILEKSISKNLDETIKNYNYDSETLEITANAKHKEALESYELMKLYAKKNDVSLWDSPQSSGDIQANQVTEVHSYSNYSRSKTTDDELVDGYVECESQYKTLLLKSKEAKAVADTFSANKYVFTPEERESVEKTLSDIMDKVVNLIDKAVQTVGDYNEYKSAENISYITGILVQEDLPKMLYMFVFVVLGFGISVVTVIAWNIYQNVRYECIRRSEESLLESDKKPENSAPPLDEDENVLLTEEMIGKKKLGGE